MSPAELPLLLHLVATLTMTGLIWFVQVVHYPLFAQVGAREFAGYQAAHRTRTSWVVGPPMLVELATALWLVWQPPAGQPTLPLLGLALLAVVWLSTLLLQVPRHGELAQGFDRESHRLLVATNWIRTLAWTARGALVLVLVGTRA